MNVRRLHPRALFCALAVASLSACAPGSGAGDAGVPAACTAEVNRQIGALIERADPAQIDGVRVCGTTISSSRPLRAGRYGAHQLIPLRIPVAGGRFALVEVVTNDDLDGRVTAPRGAHVFALGQYYRTTARQRPYVAGIHDVHCATHRGAANGYVVVDGRRFGCGS